MIGKTLGHYEITGLLGKGGMGEVYRARDKTLNREVALKLLPSEFSHDPERVARFAREATTLAKLQHANIATIYGFEQTGEHPFLVMELVEGEDLAERLLRGPLPVEEALLLAAQIAEGIEAAHSLGIVHRDLKPANIKLTPTGDVKLLDFGLARAFSGEADRVSTLEISNSPTITAAMTQAGVILGTAAYMSPEQARGKTIDKQADVWSFGVVVYEMLTNERLFGGETVSDSIGAILHRDLDLTRLPVVPAQIHTLLRRCLARGKRQRLRDIGDARLEIEDAMAARGQQEKKAGRRRAQLPWLVAAVLGAAAVALGWLALTRSPEMALKATTLGLPRDQTLNLGTSNAWPRAQFAPDGQHIAYIGGDDFEIYRRGLDSFESTVIPGTKNAALFTYSPDGRWIAYMAGSKLWKVALSGGAPVPLCETATGPGLAWGVDEIYFTRGNGGGLWAVSADGGVLIGLLSLDTGEVTVLIQGGTQPKYAATGHVIYGRNAQLLAVRFDLGTLTVQGTSTLVLEGLSTVDVNGTAQYSLAPDGLKMATMVSAANDKIFIHDFQRKAMTRLTSTPGNDGNPVWSPDGRQIAYRNDRNGTDDMYLIPADGSAPARQLLQSSYDDMPDAWTHDGQPVRVSINGGFRPQWSPDGQIIYYVANKRMLAVKVQTAGSLRVGEPKEIVDSGEPSSGTCRSPPMASAFWATA